MKCDKCGYEWINSGDSAHVCGAVNFPAVKAAKEQVKEHIKYYNEMMGEPEQEPVGEVILYTGDGFPCAPFKQVKWTDGVMPDEGTKFYTTPPQRKPLTDEQIAEMWQQYNPLYGIASFARAIEAAHGIYAPTELKE
jgi:hypothetical protein